MNLTKLFASLLVLPMFTFCNAGTTDSGTENGDETEPVFTIIGDQEFHFGGEGGTATLKFSTNMDWTAEPGSSWIKVNPSSGAAGENISVTITCEKTTKQKKRTSDITMSIPKRMVLVTNLLFFILEILMSR